jgi:hypothetical protein
VIVRLLLYLVLAALALVVPFGGVALLVRPLLRARRARRLGQLHAEHTCLRAECGQYVDPSSPDSIFENGRWMHRRCRQELLS